ncbi:MAG: DNA mismatch repair protein MutS [Christensenellales bacterium]|jgi:DNA mismatch repair protein MutS
MAELTPMMRQHLEIKEKYKDCLVFFRLGDFYEMFFEDAMVASRELELTLTGRDCGLAERAPMCGVPHHSADTYISRLIAKGYKVAIAEQITEPAPGALVERDVVRVVTPGTVLEESMLDSSKNNYLVSLCLEEGRIGLAYTDISTGEFVVDELTGENATERMMDELARIDASELIVDEAMMMKSSEIEDFKKRVPARMDVFQTQMRELRTAEQMLCEHFQLKDLSPYGIDKMPMAACAAAALLDYLNQTQKHAMAHIARLNVQKSRSVMMLDAMTRHSLEITQTMRTRSKKGSLLGLLDKTQTSMGARMLRRWVEQPLLDVGEINRRLDAVEEFCSEVIAQSALRDLLNQVYDMERLASRVSVGSAGARDLLSLGRSLTLLPQIKTYVLKLKSPLIADMAMQIDLMRDVGELLSSAISPDAPLSVRDPGVIAQGFDDELDKLRDAALHSRDWIAQLEKDEREATGIKNLKVGYNKVFGYYIEVTRSNLSVVPMRYVRKQTLVGAERYITPELKEIEQQLTGVEDKIAKLEYALFLQVRDSVAQEVERIHRTAGAIATLDCLQSFANVAQARGYVRPAVDDSEEISVTAGRHPVVEAVQTDTNFVPNDVKLDTRENRFLIITGPNMAGKSTYMRQVALIALMAQMGSFVPAKQAHIGVVDRVFTRVGASDDLSGGQSTFMVEMSEMAHILAHATKKSLLILDEIGRGTSTFDGLSIAWAIVEYISAQSHLQARTLFATHYQELGELEGRLDGVKNYCVSARKYGDDIIFLRRVVRGATDRSFGIEVAKLAGIPLPVVERAKEVLRQLERSDITKKTKQIIEGEGAPEPVQQLGLFAQDADTLQVVSILRDLNLTAMTPMEAINTLESLQNKLQKSE